MWIKLDAKMNKYFVGTDLQDGPFIGMNPSGPSRTVQCSMIVYRKCKMIVYSFVI